MPEDQLKHQAPSNLISLFQFELKKLLILIFGIFFSISAEAFFFQSISLSEKETTPFIIDSLIDEYSLINHCSFLLDPNDDYSIQHLLDSSHDSIFSSASFFSKKRIDVNTNPWIKVVLQSQLKEFNTFRFYPYGKTTSDIEIYPDVLEVYLVDSIGQILNKKTGAHLPYSSIDKGEPALEKYRKEYNAITFQLAPNEIRTIYVKATSVSFKLSVRPTLSPILSATAEHEKLLLERRLPDAFYQGIIWMLFGYHFLIFLVRREGTYLLFSIYLLAAALYYLSLSTLSFYAFPEWLPFIKYFPVWSIGTISLVFFILFQRSLINLKDLLPKWDKFYKILVAYLLLGFIYFQSYYLLTNDAYFPSISSSMNLAGIASLGIIAIIFPLLRYRDPVIRLFVLGNAIYGLGILLAVAQDILWSFGLLQELNIILTLKITNVLHFIVFSIGLGLKTLKMEQDKKQLEQLYQFKTNFITNITHEFRTPFTIILGMADEILSKPNIDLEKKVNLIKDNSNRLLHLVDQILDLAKLESKNDPTEMIQDDIIPFMAYLVDSFSSFAGNKNISLQFYSETPSTVMDFDAEKIRKIITNLISNAIKFTPEYGKILVIAKMNKKELLIKVIDSGKGIPPKHLPNIFTRFYRVNEAGDMEGSGIGLAIVKELMLSLHGKIEVESKVNKGTTFLLSLPIKNKAPLVYIQPKGVNKSINKYAQKKKNRNSDFFFEQETNKPQLLIVEDNADLIFYLKNCLADFYHIEVSRNGNEGIKQAFESIPDIIISDIMMPEKNGFELCKAIKKDIRTSHIPIILLTAKSDNLSKLKGLEMGADAYLKKPFKKEELLLRISNLISLREKLKSKYASIESESTIPIKVLSKEDEFIQQLNDIIQQNIDDSNFSTTQLCQKMAMSRTQLHRKIKALTNTSTALYIRKYRLQHAHRLLKNTDLRISEVASATGFENYSWFTQAFKEEFGQNPSNLRK